jgi:glyoxylase-like metal-dependent hydrolase (beta-lactamase superfamily II)
MIPFLRRATIPFAACTAAVALTAAPTSSPRDRAAASAEYTIDAIRYATIRGFPLSGLVMGAPRDERIDIAMVVWLVRGEGRTILFDVGFHRERWFAQFDIADYIRPDSAVRLAGVRPEDVTDIIVSHAHWDHMGGIDLFPAATIHIQRDEFAYYTGDAWQEGGRRGGIDTLDIAELVRRNMRGKVRLIAGDDVEILPGIRAFTGARHTYASQYIRVDGTEAFVLASDNCYLYRNLETGTPGATFTPEDRAGNVAALERMRVLAGSPGRVVPGHDVLQFQRFPTNGRVARISGR